MIFGASSGAAPATPIRAIQQTLQHLGTGVRLTGRLDQATVDAINGVLGGWDDAPPALRTGKLSQHDIAAHIRDVAKYLRLAAGGAMTVSAGD
jgi:hypothetical protein